MKYNWNRHLKASQVLAAFAVFSMLVLGGCSGDGKNGDAKITSVEEQYPGLSMGLLKNAKLAKLKPDILAETGGVCPIARCSKRMLNGPCGGSDQGKCEISKDVPCGWELIYQRLKTLGQLDRFEKPVDPKDWTTSRDGGPRTIVREDLRI